MWSQHVMHRAIVRAGAGPRPWVHGMRAARNACAVPTRLASSAVSGVATRNARWARGVGAIAPRGAGVARLPVTRRWCTTSSDAALRRQRARELDMLDPTPLPRYHVPPPPPPPSQSAKASNRWGAPLGFATTIGLLLYASYRALNTAQIRLIMEDHSPSWVAELRSRGILQPFSEVVVDINREQLGERIFLVCADSETRISKRRILEIAETIGSMSLSRYVTSVFASLPQSQPQSMTADQFVSCFATATLEDVEDDAMYFAVRETYDIVPLPRKAKAMLSNLHNQCRRHRAVFSVPEVRELCDKLSLPFDADEESAGELAQLQHKHVFVDYFARKFEGTDIATMLVRIKAVLMYAATHS